MLNQSAVSFPRYQSTFPTSSSSGGILSRSIGMPSLREGPPNIWDTHGLLGNVFRNPVASSSAPCPQELNSWSFRIEEPLHSSTVERVRGKHKIKIRDASLDRQPKIRSSSVEETLQRIMEQTNNDCRFQTFTLTNSLLQQRSLAGR